MGFRNEPLLFARLFPEIELFKDAEQRRAAILEAISHQKKTLVLEIVLIGVSVSLFLYWFRGTVGTASVLWQVLAGAGVLVTLIYVLAVLSLVVHAKKIRRALRTKLNEFGIPICMRCGYQLKGTPEPRCPECGTRVYRGLSEDVPWSDEEQAFFFDPPPSRSGRLKGMRSKFEPIFFDKLFPEVNLLEDDEQRRAAVTEAMRRCKPTTYIAPVVSILSVVLLGYWFSAAASGHRFLFLSVLVVVFAFGSSILALFIHAGAIRRSLREQLNEFGIPICVECGYRMEESVSPRCPECGRPFEPQQPDEKTQN